MNAGRKYQWWTYIWGGFDALRLHFYTMKPEQGSRPMSASASICTRKGAGASCWKIWNGTSRGRIYAEVLGGNVNWRTTVWEQQLQTYSGSCKRCDCQCWYPIRWIDTINGHLTATSKDSLEIKLEWSFRQKGHRLPYINPLKSTMVVIVSSAAGSIECCSCIAIASWDLFFPILIVKTLTWNHKYNRCIKNLKNWLKLN
jgi:hypothetical protein